MDEQGRLSVPGTIMIDGERAACSFAAAAAGYTFLSAKKLESAVDVHRRRRRRRRTSGHQRQRRSRAQSHARAAKSTKENDRRAMSIVFTETAAASEGFVNRFDMGRWRRRPYLRKIECGRKEGTVHI